MESMSDALAALDQLMQVFDRQSDINESILALVQSLELLDDQRASEITELREGMAALSNRIEAVTRESVRVLRQP